jgi:FAD/FMN-containing dehydrogenase
MCFGHLGDGNLHFNLFPPGHYASADALESGPGQTLTPIVLDLVAALGGSFSAEHGVGQFKVNTLQHYRDPIEVGLMRQLKDAWDPHHLMNPGKLFPHE